MLVLEWIYRSRASNCFSLQFMNAVILTPLFGHAKWRLSNECFLFFSFVGTASDASAFLGDPYVWGGIAYGDFDLAIFDYRESERCFLLISLNLVFMKALLIQVLIQKSLSGGSYA